jgi:iron(III) transport system substrate-binding protein
MSRHCILEDQATGLFQATLRRKKMLSIRFHRAASILAVLVLYLLNTVNVFAAAAPISASQLALYQGTDREKILIEGAKKEETFTLYDSHTWFRTIAKEFEKKYPFIKVSEFRTDGRNLIKRAIEEIAAGQYIADVIATTSEQMAIMKREGVFQE